MIIVFGNSFSYTTNLFMNSETAVSFNRGHFNQVFFVVYSEECSMNTESLNDKLVQ